MTELAPQVEPSETKLPEMSEPAPQALNAGPRPLPWPVWKGPRGPAQAAALLAFWVLSLLLALVARYLGQRTLTPISGPWEAGALSTLASFLLGNIAWHLPWTLAVLWLLFAGPWYGAALLLGCAFTAEVPKFGEPWFGQLFGLIVFVGLQQGLTFDPCLRGLAALGSYVFAAFSGAVACSMTIAYAGEREALANWSALWFTRFAQDLAITGPLAFLAGPCLERLKTRAFGPLAPYAGSFRQQIQALVLGLAAVIAFCVTWMLASDLPLATALDAYVTDTRANKLVERAQRLTASRKAALVALLLGALGTGGSIIIILMRRYRAELRAEVQRNTAAFRRRHEQMAELQQATEAVNIKARRYAADLGELYRLSQQLAAENEEAGILQAAARAARRILGAQAVAIFMRPGKGPQSCLRCVACDGIPEKLARARQALVSLQSQGLVAEAMRDTRTVAVGVRTPAAAPRALADGWEERSAIAVPLPLPVSDRGAAGAVLWVLEGREPIGLEEVGLAEEVARQTASALRRARLVAQARQQTEELKLLEQIGRSLSQRLTVAHTLEQTVQEVSRIVVAERAAVFVLDHATQMISTYASNPPLSQFPTFSVSLNGHSIIAACMKEGRTLVVSDVDQDPRCDAAAAHRYGAAALICVPLGTAPQRFGVLLVAKGEPGEYDPDEVRRVEQVAQLACGAIERAKLYEEACRRADELILLNEVGHLLVESPALEGTLQRIAELVCRHFHLGGAGFLLLDESRQALVSSAISGVHTPEAAEVRIPLEAQGITTLALRQNQALVIEDAGNDTRVDRTLLRVLPGAASGAVIPMAGTGGPAGVFGVWKTQPYALQPHELQCLGSVARLAAAAVGRNELVRALQASEKRLQEVVDGIHDIIVSIDPAGNVLSFNAAAERMTGRKRAEVLGRSLASVLSLSAAERGRLERFIGSAFKALDCSAQLVLNWPSHEGGERRIRWRASFLRSSDGKVTGMVCLGVDITEQTLLEAQLLQAQKMESVGALAGGMAHDFNNLLGGIIGQCAVARSQTGDARMLGSLANIESAAQRGADLTAKLMTFARKSVLQPRAVNFGTLIQETVALLSGSLPRSIRIVSTVAPDLPLVHGDPTQLQQVLLNLCVNARDAMPDGGTLTIRAAADPAGGPAADAAGVRVAVADTGTGMTEEVQAHLFEPFFTTKQPGKGTGLGLSVVFGILRSHGGHISFNSAVGEGTCFSIRLPRARPPSGKMVIPSADRVQAGLAQPPPASFAGRENLLLVDDDAILRETLRQLLENLGYTVRTSGGGAEALAILDAGAGFVPDMILLDVVMPGLAGVALFAELRKRLPGVPVLLMSGYSADQTVIGMLEAGAQELIQKPFTIETIAWAVRRGLAGLPANKGGA